MSSSTSTYFDDDEGPREISGFVSLELILQHGHHGTASVFRVEFPLFSSIKLLKKDMEPRIKVKPEFQEWFYKGILLKDDDTMLSLKVNVDDKIVVKERT
ncbi:unnamed protein product [Lymnaea stagnalis]|uniref:Ubiquitin-like domain-containing protein n=1 Tax=Lymnaea stagnalis TaxID=6523 RepID=A0AAV2HZI0_LYMST